MVLIDVIDTGFEAQPREICRKHAFLPPSRVCKVYKLGCGILWRPSAAVNVHVLVLPRHAHRLSSPCIANMPHDDFQVREFECYGVDMWNWPANLAWTRRGCVSDLREAWIHSLTRKT